MGTASLIKLRVLVEVPQAVAPAASCLHHHDSICFVGLNLVSDLISNSCTPFSTLHPALVPLSDPMDEDFEASTMSDGLLDRRPRKRSINLALTLEDLYKGATKKLKVRQYPVYAWARGAGRW